LEFLLVFIFLMKKEIIGKKESFSIM